MINYIELLAILSLILIAGVLFYYLIKISVLEDSISAIDDRVNDINDKLNKKDPYEDYRNDKGLLSMKHVKERERYHGKP